MTKAKKRDTKTVKINEGKYIDQVLSKYAGLFPSYDRKFGLMRNMGKILRGVGERLPRTDMEVGPTETSASHQGNRIDPDIQKALHAEVPFLITECPFAIRYEHLKSVQWHSTGEQELSGVRKSGLVFSAELDGTSNFAISYTNYDRKGDFRSESALTLTLCHSQFPFFPLAVAIYDFDRHNLYTVLFVEGTYQAYKNGTPIIKEEVARKVRNALTAVENPRLYLAEYVNDYHQLGTFIRECLGEYRKQTGKRVEIKTGTQSTVINGIRSVEECDTIGSLDVRAEIVPAPDTPLTAEQESRLEEVLGSGYRLACLKFEDAIPICVLSEAYGFSVTSGRGNPLWQEYHDKVNLLTPRSTNQITLAQLWPDFTETEEGLAKYNILNAILPGIDKAHLSFKKLLEGKE